MAEMGAAGIRLEQLCRGLDGDALVRWAAHHRVVPQLLFDAERLGLPTNVVTALTRLYVPGVHQQLRAAGDLAQLAPLLTEAGVPWALLKGAILSETVYDRPELRPFTDLDILVPPVAFAEVVALLERHGAQVMDRNWELLLRELRGQVHVVLPGGTLLDLHWHLVNRASVRRCFPIDTTAVLTRTVVRRVSGHDVPTFDPSTTLGHLCLHAALSGGDRLGWLADIDRVVASWRPDWVQVAALARQWQARLAIGVVLRRAQTTLRTPVPNEVLELLMGGWGGRVANRIDRRWPVAACRGPDSVLAIVTPMLRDGGFGASPLVRRLRSPAGIRAAWASARTRHRGAQVDGQVDDQPQSLLMPTGGPEGRTAYFHAVATLRSGR